MRSIYTRPALGAVVLLAIGVSAGCGGPTNGAPDNGPVRGRVTLDGNPLARVMVTFTNPVNGFGFNTQTDANGGYEVKSYKDVGLPAGTYQVSVAAAGTTTDAEEVKKLIDENYTPVSSGPSAEVAKALPLAYGTRETSGLTVEVAAGKNPSFDFELTSKKK